MWDDFIAGSLAAIDILIYVLYGERREKPVDKEDYAEHLQRKVPKTHKVKREIRALQMFLAGYHNPSRPVCDDDPDDLMNPLTAEQIAEALDWTTPKGRLNQTKVSRRMEAIFGSPPMEKYRMSLISGDEPDTFSDRLKNGTHAGERFVESDTVLLQKDVEHCVCARAVSSTHLRVHETLANLVYRLLLQK